MPGRAINRILTTVSLYGAVIAIFLMGRTIDEEQFLLFYDEDGIIENFGVAALVVAVGVFLVTWRRGLARNEQQTLIARYGLARLFLVFVLFVALGEEISWGQRIFGWQTPESIAELNLQGETNLHNMVWFLQPDSTIFSRLLTVHPGTLFSAFCMVFGVLLPLMTIVSRRFANYCDDLKIPVPSIWLGSSFLVVYLSVHAIGDGQPKVNEIKETLYEVVWALIAVADALKHSGKRRIEDFAPPPSGVADT